MKFINAIILIFRPYERKIVINYELIIVFIFTLTFIFLLISYLNFNSLAECRYTGNAYFLEMQVRRNLMPLINYIIYSTPISLDTRSFYFNYVLKYPQIANLVLHGLLLQLEHKHYVERLLSKSPVFPDGIEVKYTFNFPTPREFHANFKDHIPHIVYQEIDSSHFHYLVTLQ